MCGPEEIDGYDFCLGLRSLQVFYKDRPDLHNLIYPVTYLIRKAKFRPKHGIYWSDMSFLAIRPLGELLDMFHTHEATVRHDKVYALLGMGSDTLNVTDLLPDYEVAWGEVFQRLIGFLLCKQVSIETWNDREIAVIKSEGCILGQVSSVERDTVWGDEQRLGIIFKNIPGFFEHKREWNARWTLQTSAKSIQPGDLVCLLRGAQYPVIARIRKDHITVIMIAPTTQENMRTESRYERVRWPELLRSVKTFPLNFLLVWDWEKSPETLRDGEEYGALIKSNGLVLGHSESGLEHHLGNVTRLHDVALVLKDLGEYEKAEKRLQEVIEGYERVFGKQYPDTPTGKDNLTLIYKNTRKWVLEEIDPDTLSNLASLASTYRDQRNLFQRIYDDQITEEEIVQITRSFNKKVVTLLFKQRGDNIHITRRVVEVAVGNIRNGKEVMMFLLEQQENDIQVTEGVVKAAAENQIGGKDLMTLLLERRGNGVQITEGAVVQIARLFDKEIVIFLLEQYRNNIQITEEIVKAAAENQIGGKDLMTFLLEQYRNNIQITEEIVKVAAGNQRDGKDIMILLLERYGNNIRITEEIVKVAAKNQICGKDIMTLLLERRGMVSRSQKGQ
jgi:hypothetical protein